MRAIAKGLPFRRVEKKEEEQVSKTVVVVFRWPWLLPEWIKAQARWLYQETTLWLAANSDWLLCLVVALVLFALAVIFTTDLPLPAVWSR